MLQPLSCSCSHGIYMAVPVELEVRRILEVVIVGARALPMEMPLNVMGRQFDKLLLELINAWHCAALLHSSYLRFCCVQAWAALFAEEW